MHQPGWKRFWGRINTCICMTESLHCLPETITTLLISYAAAAKLLQLCPTLCDPRDGSPPGSAVPGILLQGLLLPKSMPPDWMGNKHLHGSKAHRPLSVPRLKELYAALLIRALKRTGCLLEETRTYPGPGHRWHQMLGSSGILAGFFFLCSD